MSSLNEVFRYLLMQKIKNKNDLLVLRECLTDFMCRGMDKTSMFKTLEEMRIGCDEETENTLLELMDFVSGFCRPDLHIF